MSKTLRDYQIHLRVAGELWARLDEEAALRGRNRSDLIRQILIEHTLERVAGNETQQREAA
jgi:predicted DNA-binding protein